MSNEPKVSQIFMSIAKNAPEHQKKCMEIAVKISDASKLDKKQMNLHILLPLQP